MSLSSPFRTSLVLVLLSGMVGCSQQSGVPVTADAQSGGNPQRETRGDAGVRSAVRATAPDVTKTDAPSRPAGGLIAVGDTLYGTTDLGGTKGSVYAFDPGTNVVSTIYDFYTAEGPEGRLVAADGGLFGVTSFAGKSFDGELFGISQTTHKLLDVYAFKGGDAQPPDAAAPDEGLIYRKDASGDALLLGTTLTGGGGSGTIYEYSLSGHNTGKVTVLYSFRGGADGEEPRSRLINPGGTMFYGTASGGGTVPCGNNDGGCGTVFSFDLATGTEITLHDFKGGKGSAAFPDGTLYDLSGELYGTTESGGVGSPADGTVFKVNATSGVESLIHSFPAYVGDGEDPSFNGFVNVGGLLYGMTREGGTGPCNDPNGCGTVFTMDPSTGKEAVLYSFAGSPSDAANPVGSLLDYNGKLYGTTPSGGTNNQGAIFSITPQGGEQLLYSF
jgi:uncharacterized repeat protein (TIGR03803 family)